MKNTRSLAIVSAAVVLSVVGTVEAWTTMQQLQRQPLHVSPSPSLARHATTGTANHPISHLSLPQYSSIRLLASVQETPSTVPSSPPDDNNNSSLISDDEWSILSDLRARATKAAAAATVDVNKKDIAFQSAVEETLPTLSPSLIMKLRSGESGLPKGTSSNSNKAEDKEQIFQDISQSLEKMLNRRLEKARDTLTELMNAGEIKKLDALIGKAARAQELDVAFFQVLQMNMQDAAMEVAQQEAAANASGETKEEEGDNYSSAETVNRLQILQHIHTRCQEEVEKTINPGIALLSKLLRTDVDSIRRNQLEHYLCPQPTTITAPDGKQIELKNPQNEKSLVDHQDFVNAIANAVKQIRTVEQAGGTDKDIAADMVESCRQVAKEARIVIGERFGTESEQLKAFEDSLFPVFRPSSPESPYIQGETASS